MIGSRFYSFCLVLAVVLLPIRAAAQGTEAAFANANALYESGQWSSAAAEYHQLLEAGIESGPLHLNLGSAYYQMERPGEALYHFLRALRLDPSLDEARQNLRYVRGTDDIPYPAPSQRALLLIRWTWIVSLLLIVGAVAATIRWRSRASAPASTLLAAGIILAGGALAASAVVSRPVDILTRGPAPAYATHDGLDRMGYEVPEGARVRIIDRSGPRLLVEADGRRGWVDAHRVRSL